MKYLNAVNDAMLKDLYEKSKEKTAKPDKGGNQSATPESPGKLNGANIETSVVDANE